MRKTWTGAAGNAWEHPLKWSCGVLTDAYTDMFINCGSLVINSNTTIRSLRLAANETLTVAPGVVSTILH